MIMLLVEYLADGLKMIYFVIYKNLLCKEEVILPG